MKKITLVISAVSLLATVISVQLCSAVQTSKAVYNINKATLTDTVPPSEITDVVTTAIYALNSFEIAKVADLYTPNAVVADDEPPYSWNGPTAGVQWVSAVEEACRDNRLTKLKGTIEAINVFHQTAENAYVVVPVSYVGNLPGKRLFKVEGAFTFVLRMIDGKWMIKSQTWMPKKAL